METTIELLNKIVSLVKRKLRPKGAFKNIFRGRGGRIHEKCDLKIRILSLNSKYNILIKMCVPQA